MSVSLVSSSNITRPIPCTSANKSVHKYEHALNGLLEHGDGEVREKIKEVVRAVESASEEVERIVGEVIEKRLSYATSITEEPIMGFEVDEDMVAPSSTAKQIAVDDVCSS